MLRRTCLLAAPLCWSAAGAVAQDEPFAPTLPAPAAVAEDDDEPGRAPAPAEEPIVDPAVVGEKQTKLREFGRDSPSNRAKAVAEQYSDALRRLLEQEADRRLENALDQTDPTERDKQLIALEESTTMGSTVAGRKATEILDRRRLQRGVGKKVYPTPEALEEARQEEREERREQTEEELIELRELTDDLLTDDLADKVRAEFEVIAWEEFRAIRRLVPQQQICRLLDLAERFPNTRAAAAAREVAQAAREQRIQIAEQDFAAALCAPLVFDQRWRRLKELAAAYPETPAAVRAEVLLSQHAATLPPLTIINERPETITVTVEQTYDGETEHRLKPGASVTVPAMFDSLVRVPLGDRLLPIRVPVGAVITIPAEPHPPLLDGVECVP
jgi:hypothetical protein